MNANAFYNKVVKFCPECGKELEHSPISGWLCCFLHGNFIVVDDKIVWDVTVNLVAR